MKTPKDTVRNGYDRVSFAYREDCPDRASESYKQYEAWIAELGGHLPQSSSVLDLGCGCGVPAARLLSRRFRVTGVDISPIQIQRAKMLVPKADFILGDMCEVEFKPAEFDAVVCLYAIIHVPLAEQRQLLSNLSSWLKPGGFLLLSAGYREWTAEYYPSVDETRSLIEGAGMEIVDTLTGYDGRIPKQSTGQRGDSDRPARISVVYTTRAPSCLPRNSSRKLAVESRELW